MPPKKAAAAANGDDEDVSCDQFYKFYRKNCTTMEIPVNPRIKEMYEEYVEEGKQITKVRPFYHSRYQLSNFCHSDLRSIFGVSWAGKEPRQLWTL